MSDGSIPRNLCRFPKIVGIIFLLISPFPDGLDGKASAYNAGDPGSIPGSGRSPEGNGNPLPVLLPGKSHGQRSLVGYSPNESYSSGYEISSSIKANHTTFQGHPWWTALSLWNVSL